MLRALSVGHVSTSDLSDGHAVGPVPQHQAPSSLRERDRPSPVTTPIFWASSQVDPEALLSSPLKQKTVPDCSTRNPADRAWRTLEGFHALEKSGTAHVAGGVGPTADQASGPPSQP